MEIKRTVQVARVRPNDVVHRCEVRMIEHVACFSGPFRSYVLTERDVFRYPHVDGPESRTPARISIRQEWTIVRVRISVDVATDQQAERSSAAGRQHGR